MKIQIEVGRPRWLRAPRSLRGRALAAAVAAAAVAVPVALAAHTFADVPNSNPHHDDVSAIFGARITAGCNPPANTLYCPADPVRRDQMATFLRRGLGRIGTSGTTAGVALTTTYQDIASTTITAGGAAGGTGFVLLLGSFTAINRGLDLASQARVEFRFIESGTGFTSNESSMTLEPGVNAFPSAAGAKQWLFSIPTATARTYRLQARLAFTVSQTITAESRLITALYVPFGSTGGSVLGGGPGTPEMPPATGEG